MNTRKINVLLVDDHPILRRGIRDVLESSGDISVCGDTNTANSAMAVINKDLPDVVIVDIMLDGNVNGIDLVKSIAERFPTIHTLVLSMHDESVYAVRALKAGARGFLMKSVAPKQIVEAVRTIHTGELYLKDKLLRDVVDKMLYLHKNTNKSSADGLSDRELEIFELIGNGCRVREISKKLNLSTNTVESHKKNIMKKIDISNSADLSKSAIQWVITQQISNR